MHRYKITGFIIENGESVNFEVITPKCVSSYQATIYVIGKYPELKLYIDYESITMILEED